MIPLVVPPLTNLRVMVTRPALQSKSLCNAIVKLGGEAIRFPVLEIQARAVSLVSTHYDLVIFVSANAVVHGASLLSQITLPPQIAVIGNATAAALKEKGFASTIVAAAPFNSESLLHHAALQSPPKSILLIKGVGGRDALQETLLARGAQVETVEVYERVTATVDKDDLSVVQRALREAAIHVITLTSADIAQALTSLLNETDLAMVRRCAVLAGSQRIAAQLPSMGWRSECVVSESPDDESMLKALTRWHSRSRG